MNTNNRSEISFVYPTQPIHPNLVDRLYRLADQLLAEADRKYGPVLSADLGSRLIASTLRSLDEQFVCLAPRDPAGLAKLNRKACGLLRYKWNSTYLRDIARQLDTPVTSTDALPGDAWHPQANLRGVSTRKDEIESPYPGVDLLAGAAGLDVLDLLQGSFHLEFDQAFSLLLEWTQPSRSEVELLLSQIGCEYSSPAALNKWLQRNHKKYKQRLRGPLRRLGYEGRDRASPEGDDESAAKTSLEQQHQEEMQQPCVPTQKYFSKIVQSLSATFAHVGACIVRAITGRRIR